MEKTIKELVIGSFLQEVLEGLSAEQKYLPSKYFYDSVGDKLFQQIMNTPEYYLTSAEMEIFRSRCGEMIQCVNIFHDDFDIVELGAGDALKSRELLRCLRNSKTDFTYFPIDISADMISYLEADLPLDIPGLAVNGIAADYFEGLNIVTEISAKPKLALFLGSNIGNMPPAAAEDFLKKLKSSLSPGDLLLIGFDLKKNPWDIFYAYNDRAGITEEFNLNLLRRINEELGGNFRPGKFKHYESYDPETGACKSYLISLCSQTVAIEGMEFHFKQHEPVFMEISQKYSLEDIRKLGSRSGIQPIKELFDTKNRFADIIFTCADRI